MTTASTSVAAEVGSKVTQGPEIVGPNLPANVASGGSSSSIKTFLTDVFGDKYVSRPLVLSSVLKKFKLCFQA